LNIQSYDDFIEHYYVSHETFKKFLIYHKLLIEWQKKINLVSNSSVKNSLCRHFLDSAQLYKLLRKSKGAVLDFGSGAGFPGLVLAIMGIKNVHLVESKKKKCMFMEKVLMETGTTSEIHNKRIELLPFIKPDFIISRAMASTKKLIEISYNYCNKQNYLRQEKTIMNKLPNLLFLKGKNFQLELDDLSKAYTINFDLINSISDKQGKILFFKKKY